MTQATPPKSQNPTTAKAPADARRRNRPDSRRRPDRPAPAALHPVLLQLAELHPQLFGARALPLKLGTFQDLMARHAGVLEPAALKEALGRHTRSTRYLDAVSRGVPRHDLEGQPVAEMALEHQHHALQEFYRRRQSRQAEDQQPVMRKRLRALFLSKGLALADYAAAAKTDPEALVAMLDAAEQDQAADIARREALLRAFESSGQSVEAFADAYGLPPAEAARTLQSAGDDRRIRQLRHAEPEPTALR